MRVCLPFLILLLIASAALIQAAEDPIPMTRHLLPAERIGDQPAPQMSPTRLDTVWFGGLDENGLAKVNGIWDFDTDLHGDPLQGWTSRDMTTDQFGISFGRVTTADFPPPDPFMPMMPGDPPGSNVGQLWVGIHQEEALNHDFVGGMGYGNRMCQRAVSPSQAIDPDSEAVTIEFQYFTHSELEYDYTYLYLLCYDASDLLLEQVLVESFDGVTTGGDSAGAYNWETPQDYAASVPAGSFDPQTARVELELRFYSDGGWSDQDGHWVTPAGPFGVDDVRIEIGSNPAVVYDFEMDEQGWTFAVCEGIGAYIGIVDEPEYMSWIEHSGLQCGCGLDGYALELIDEENSPYWPPGHPDGQRELVLSNVIPRDPAYDPMLYNTTLLELDAFLHLDYETCTRYRVGFKYYPYTSAVNPEPHWSPQLGTMTWYYQADPLCDRELLNLRTLDGQSGTPCPGDWDSLRICYEVWTAGSMPVGPFQYCRDLPAGPGNTDGTPVLDNLRVGLTGTPDAPAISFKEAGGQFHDGFGQRFPGYLEPGDVGNANHTRDLSHGVLDAQNDWHADTAVIEGPLVDPGNPDERWWSRLHLRVARKGPRQDLVQGYHAWKARLSGDPEGEEFVAALMDSSESLIGGQWIGWAHRFATYFHEEDPGFDPAYPDQDPMQEILPDGIWTPGTRIEYYYTSFWYDNSPHPEPEETFRLPESGAWEFEILPGMRRDEQAPGAYDVLWPAVLHIDAYNGGVQPYVSGFFATEEIALDRFDYLDSSSNWNCSFARDFGGMTFNPGGYGNNGCTLEQLLGYRLILSTTGTNSLGCMEEDDFTLCEDWLANTSLGTDYRKGIIFDGDQVCAILEDRNPAWAQNVLGVSLADDGAAYREYNNDWTPCVELEEHPGYAYAIADPGVRLYGSGCTELFSYNVLETLATPGVVGNLDYYNYTNNPNAYETYVSFAQVVREKILPGEANWKTIVNGFSLHHLSEIGCVAGDDCSSDSGCVADGVADVFGPAIAWILEGADPLDPWSRTPLPMDPEDERLHLGGPATHLYPCRPNPLRKSARIEFSLGDPADVELTVYDVTGRTVRTLVNRGLEGGDHAVVWEGRDDRGNPVEGGVYWVQMKTSREYKTCKRILLLR